MSILFAIENQDLIDRIFHPFGDLRWVRWFLFALLVAAWAAYPLIFRRKHEASETEEQSAGPEFIPVRGYAWAILGGVGLLALFLMVILPYTYDNLEWKLFDPFDDRNGGRLLTFLLFLPLIIGYALVSYFRLKRPITKPVRLALAGVRAIALWIVLIMLAGPFISKERRVERPHRSIVMIDDSLSMGEVVREFPIFSALEISSSTRDEIARRDQEGFTLSELDQMLVADAEASRAAADEILALGFPLGEAPRVELSDIAADDFTMRKFVRELVLLRAKRLAKKLETIHGSSMDLNEWMTIEARLAKLRKELQQKQDEVAAEELQEKPDPMRLRMRREEAVQLQDELTREESRFEGLIESGILYQRMATDSSNSLAISQARRDRVKEVVTGIVRNLLSTIHPNGPTRWDVATELLQPGNTLTIQKLGGANLLKLATSPASGQLTLVDLLRRNSTAQEDRLPADIAAMLNQGKGSASSLIESSREPLSVYTFSSAEMSDGGIIRQTEIEELDVLRPRGLTTQVYAAYNAILANEQSGELSSLLILTDGHDTSREGNKEAERALRNAAALPDEEDSPAVITVAVGHPRPEKILQLKSVSGDREAIKGESVKLELLVRANENWDVEVVLCENRLDNEIAYQSLNGKRDTTKVQIKGDPTNEGSITRLELVFQPGEGPEHRRYWIKLNRQRMPGEDTYENNVLTHDLKVIDRKIRVLLIDERFRFETRYMIEAMARDQALEFQSFIYDADNGWPQRTSEYSREVEQKMPPLVGAFCKIVDEGTSKARSVLTREKDEWFETNYDVVIIGDVAPTSLGWAQREWLNEFVTQKRGGIIWLAGRNHMPFDYTDPYFQEILPVKTERPDDEAQGGFRVDRMKYFGLTLHGRTHDVMRFSDDVNRQMELWGKASDSGIFRPGQLDGYYWYANIKDVKDTRSLVLARVARGNELFNAGDGTGRRSAIQPGTPIVVAADYQSGRSLYVGTDELWRMRRYFGDFFTYRFWQNAIRWAATSKLKAKKDGIDLRTDQERYLLGETVNVFCDLIGTDELYANILQRQRPALDKLARESTGLNFEDNSYLIARWRKPGSEGDEGRQEGQVLLREMPLGSRHFEGKIFPNTTGKYELFLEDEPTTTKTPSYFFVQPTSEQLAEVRETQVNAPLLKSLSTPLLASNDSAAMDAEAKLIGYRSHFFHEADRLDPDLRSTIVIEGITEREAFNLIELLLVLIGLFGLEWFVRKLVRLA